MKEKKYIDTLMRPVVQQGSFVDYDSIKKG